MNQSQAIEPTSTEHLLACLDLVIDEARLVMSIFKLKDTARELKQDEPFSQ